MKKIIRYYQKIRVLLKPLKKEPTFVSLEISPNCFLKCKHCDIWKLKKRKAISFPKAKIIIDKLYQWIGCFNLSFTGGEPFLNKDFPKIIAYANSKGINTHVNTNGYLITESLAKEIVASGLSGITFSLDSTNPQAHDWFRGKKGTYRKALQAISLIKKHRKKNQPKIYLSTVIVKQNIKQLIDLIKLVEREGLDGISFQSLMPNFGNKRTSNKVKTLLWPEKEDSKEFFNLLLKEKYKNNLITSSEEELRIARDYYQNNKSIESFPCQAGQHNFSVDGKGDVRLCFQYPAIGNILSSTPKNIWDGQKAKTQRGILEACPMPCRILRCNLS